MLGRVSAATRTWYTPTVTPYQTTYTQNFEQLAQFKHYADSYQVLERSTRQRGADDWVTTQPVYAGADEIADFTPAHGSTPAGLQQEYLTGGTDEILAQYTPADILNFTPLHPIQDLNRRVHLSLRSDLKTVSASGPGADTTAIGERALYTAFGERTLLAKTLSGTYTGLWQSQGFRAPQNTTQPVAAPNLLSQPLSASGQVHGFQGRRHEDLPGVMDFRNRLYDARLGRFLERDPKSDPNNPNPYAFCANNPINNLDPMGTAILVPDKNKINQLAKTFDLHYTKVSDGYLVYSAHLKSGVEPWEVGNPVHNEYLQTVLKRANDDSGVWKVGLIEGALDPTLEEIEVSTPDWYTENKSILPPSLVEGMEGQMVVKTIDAQTKANDAGDAQSAHVDDLDNTRSLSVYREAIHEGTYNPLYYAGLYWYSFRNVVTTNGTLTFDVLQGKLDRGKISLSQAKSVQTRSGLVTTGGAFCLLAPGTSSVGTLVPRYTGTGFSSVVPAVTTATVPASAAVTVPQTSTAVAEAGLAPNAQTITLLRGTNNALEISIYKESGVVLSDAGKIAYAEGRFAGRSIEESLNLATQASKNADAAQMSVWYNSRNTYAQAHGAFGQELSAFGSRSMTSWTTDPRVARYFAGEGGIVIKVEVNIGSTIPQTLPGATESEHLIIHSVVAP